MISILMRSNKIPIFLGLHRLLHTILSYTSPYDFEFALVHYIHRLRCIPLSIHCLIPLKLFQIKWIDKFFYLQFSLESHEWKIAEEFYHGLDIFVFDALENTLVVLSFYDSKLTLAQTLDSCCSWLIIDQSKFTKTASFFEPDDFRKPLIVLKALNF